MVTTINLDSYGVKDIKTLEGIEAIRLRPGMEEYIRFFNYLITKYNHSFIKFTNNENEDDKVNILHFFQHFYPNYKFYLSTKNTALFYNKE